MAATHPVVFALSTMGGLAIAALILAYFICKALAGIDSWLDK